jgi:hypothetical protein
MIKTDKESFNLTLFNFKLLTHFKNPINISHIIRFFYLSYIYVQD